MATDGNLLTRPIGRALLALNVDLPYALEKPLMRCLLQAPVFEPATPSQLCTIAAFPSRNTAAGANGMPSGMMRAMAVNIRSSNAQERPGCGDMKSSLSPATSRLSAVHSEL